ncbi:ribonuclease 3 [endosymbiont of Sipalinus gigas]|uniref:ribonuclease III n=1 Tax=endosymbiont of Sipalinus gigas TaxID=1972134 RepID=UPI000DC6E758|nr:ribonuclease III [endosymbiont of Sipalinus gigas]BBA85203.1 ribonuclease 3 [endosymbiont of Sipalinus gigas]
MNIFLKILNLEKKLKYIFKNKILLLQALSHSSFSNINNEKLEFLGDSILNFIITNKIYEKFSNLNEGEMSNLKSILVKSTTLTKIANKFEIYNYILLGKSEYNKKKYIENSILANSIEAIIGAIFLDSNIKKVKIIIDNLYYDFFLNIDNFKNTNKDFKSLLQNLLQKNKISLPKYIVLDNIENKKNNYIFLIICKIKELHISSYGIDKNKKKSEQLAAKQMLQILNLFNLNYELF